MIDEVEKANGFAWVTEGREVENYVPRRVLEELTSKPYPQRLTIYDKIMDDAYMVGFKDKVALASAAAKAFRLEDIKENLDLESQLGKLVSNIKRWNSLG